MGRFSQRPTTSTEEIDHLLELGRALLQQDCYLEALAAFERAVMLDPREPLAYWGKADALAQLHREDEALATFDLALEYNSQETRHPSAKGNLLEQLGRYEEALAAYQLAAAVDPTNLSAYYNQGWVLSNYFQRYEETLVAYRQADELDPHHTFARHDQAEMLEKLGRYE